MCLKNLIIGLFCTLAPSLVISQTNLGGIHAKRSPYLIITSQDISLSPELVKTTYVYKNIAKYPIPETFVFVIPSKTAENLKQFNITINSEPQSYKIMQRAISRNGQDISTQLRALNLPYNPVAAMQAIDASENRGSIINKLHSLQLIDKHEEIPTWIVKTYYYCEYIFESESTVVVEHSYKPSIIVNNIKIHNFATLLKLPLRLVKQAINMALPGKEDNTWAATLQSQVEKYQPQIKNYCAKTIDYHTLALNYKQNNKPSQMEFKTLHFAVDPDDSWASAIEKFTLKIESSSKTYPILCWNDRLERKSNHSLEFMARDYIPLQDINVMFIGL